MEDLFGTQLAVGNQDVTYRVYFEDERYVFQPLPASSLAPAFALIRASDTWKEEGAIPSSLKESAIEALQTYLLRQH
jgi:hypothetical protein